MDFSELIDRARRRDAAALDELFRRFSPAVLSRLRGQLGPALRRRYDTEDLGQSVFAEVLRDLPRFESDREGAFRKWLTLKARSKLWMKLRRHLDADGHRRERTWDGELRDVTRADPAVGAAAADDEAKLGRAIDGLAEDDREVLALRGDGLAWAAIAERLGLAGADAARMRYARAVLRLRERWPTA